MLLSHNHKYKVIYIFYIVRNIDYLYNATRKHFYDVTGRYGRVIYIVNLMRLK
jgi:hypothetical protein